METPFSPLWTQAYQRLVSSDIQEQELEEEEEVSVNNDNANRDEATTSAPELEACSDVEDECALPSAEIPETPCQSSEPQPVEGKPVHYSI